MESIIFCGVGGRTVLIGFGLILGQVLHILPFLFKNRYYTSCHFYLKTDKPAISVKLLFINLVIYIKLLVTQVYGWNFALKLLGYCPGSSGEGEFAMGETEQDSMSHSRLVISREI
jgi:hypothetical protein